MKSIKLFFVILILSCMTQLSLEMESRVDLLTRAFQSGGLIAYWFVWTIFFALVTCIAYFTLKLLAVTELKIVASILIAIFSILIGLFGPLAYCLIFGPMCS